MPKSKVRLTPEQRRLLNFLIRGDGSIAKSAASMRFSKRTVESLLDRGLIRDDYSMGYYSITETGEEA